MNEFADPHTILVGPTVITLIYPQYFEYGESDKGQTWFFAQPVMWNKAVTFDYPPGGFFDDR